MLDFKDMASQNDTIKSLPDQDLSCFSIPEIKIPEIKIPEGIQMQDLNCFFNESQGSLPEEMVKLAEEYGEEKRSISQAEQKIKARKRVQAEKEEKLFAMFEGCGMTTFGTGNYTYYTRVDSYPSVAEEKRAFKWIRGEGFKHIIRPTVNLKILGSMIKEVFEVTGTIPGEDDGIKIRTVNRVGVKKR